MQSDSFTCNPLIELMNKVLVVPLFFWLLVTSVPLLANTESAGSERDQSPFMTARDDYNQRLVIKFVLHESGVYELLRQMPALISQEIVTLESSGMQLSSDELAQIKKNLKGRLQAIEIRNSVMSYLQSRMTEKELKAVKKMLQAPNISRFKQLQDDADNEVAHGHMRSYKVKLQERTPNQFRVNLVSELDDSLRQTSIETEIKVELRKNLLANVSWMKSNQALPEEMLEKELHDYREKVGDHINENATVYFLYLFKKTPSSDIKRLISRYTNPEFETFMSLCKRAIVNAFKKARFDAYSNRELAGS